MMLFIKELRKNIFSVVFLLYFLGVFFMYFTQYASDLDSPVKPPAPGMEDYGSIQKEIPEILMPAAVSKLKEEFCRETYIAYPLGFYKEVKLTEKKKNQMVQILTELTGESKESILLMDMKAAPSDSLTYDTFKSLMEQADALIGGGSQYSTAYLPGLSEIPMTYEEALSQYDKFIYKDKISGAYARLYCDYLCIVLVLLPVFLGTAVSLKDKQSKMEQLVYSRGVSSIKLIGVRFISALTAALLPVILTAVMASIKVNSLYPGHEVSLLLFYAYTAVWLIPSVMIALAVGMFFTEVTNSPIGIIIQFIWYYTSLMGSAGALTGRIGKLTLIPRHNNLMKRDLFINFYENFIWNRAFYAIAAVLLILLTIFIYELKRRNKLHGFQLPMHIKNKY